MNKHQKGFATMIVVLLALVIICGGGILAWKLGWIPKFFVPTQTTPTPINEIINWKTSAPTAKGATFKYPENLPASSAGGSTNYIRPQEWPPKLLIIDNAGFSCEEGGLGINGRPGMTIQKSINNTIYCIDSVSEGAAGTFYTDYTYTFLKDGKLVKLLFTLAYPQCENYNDLQKAECEQERQTFDLDVLISRIAESVQL